MKQSSSGVVLILMYCLLTYVYMHSLIPYASTQYVHVCFMWLFLSLAIIAVYLSSYASDSCIACVFIVAVLQDGDLTAMLQPMYLDANQRQG